MQFKYHHCMELIAVLAGLCTFQWSWPRSYKLLLLLTTITLPIEVVSQYIWDTYHISNQWIYNLFLPGQFLLLVLFFYFIVFHRRIRQLQVGLLLAGVVGICICYYYTTWVQHLPLTQFNSYASTLYLVLLIISSGSFFIDAILSRESTPLIRQPGFWVATGVLFFCTLFTARFALWNLILTIPDYQKLLLYTNIIANTLLYLGITVSFLCLQRMKNSSMPLSSGQVFS